MARPQSIIVNGLYFAGTLPTSSATTGAGFGYEHTLASTAIQVAIGNGNPTPKDSPFYTFSLNDDSTGQTITARAEFLKAHKPHLIRESIEQAATMLTRDTIRIPYMARYGAYLAVYLGKDHPRTSQDSRGVQDPNILNGVVMGMVGNDPDPKRMVVATFDVRGRIMGRVTPYARDGSVVDISGGGYVAARGTSIHRHNVSFIGPWAVLSRTAARSAMTSTNRSYFWLSQVGRELKRRRAMYAAYIELQGHVTIVVSQGIISG